jgi:hypothetical protein
MLRFGKLLIRKVLRERGVLTRDRSFPPYNSIRNVPMPPIAAKKRTTPRLLSSIRSGWDA